MVRVVHNGVARGRIRAGRDRRRCHRPRLRRRIAAGQRRRRADRGDRHLKRATATPVTATIVGDGPDARRSKAQAAAPRPRRAGAFRRRHAGARGVRHGAAAGRSLARGIAALYRARGGGGRHADHRHRGRRHAGDFRARTPPISSRPTISAALARRSRAALRAIPATAHRDRRQRSQARVRAEFSARRHGPKAVLAAYREALGRDALRTRSIHITKIFEACSLCCAQGWRHQCVSGSRLSTKVCVNHVQHRAQHDL